MNGEYYLTGYPKLNGSVYRHSPFTVHRSPLLLEFYRDDLGHTRFLHGHAIEGPGGFHRSFVVSYHDKLSLLRHLGDLTDEPADVRVIKRRVDLVQQAERRGTISKDREHERDRGHRFLAAGKQKNVLQAFARGLCNDLYSGFENVVGLEQCHLTLSTAKQLAEEFDKVGVDRLECLLESCSGPLLYFAQGFFRRCDAVDDVLPLRGEEKQSLFGFGKFFDGKHVDRAEPFQPRTEVVDGRPATYQLKFLVERFAFDQFRQTDVQVLCAFLI